MPFDVGPILVGCRCPPAGAARRFRSAALVGRWSGLVLRAPPPATPHGAVRLLAGDVNATLDHAPLRELIATSCTDAADAAGAGLTGTWRPRRGLAALAPWDRSDPDRPASGGQLVRRPLGPRQRLPGGDRGGHRPRGVAAAGRPAPESGMSAVPSRRRNTQ